MRKFAVVSSKISAKAKWNVNEASIKRILDRYINKNLGNIEQVVDWYGKTAADWIERFAVLSGSPTGTNWHRYKNAERGNQYGARVDSGTMSRMIGFDTFPVNSDGIVGAEFGLLLPEAGGEKYFMDQETGNNIKSGKGMNSAARAHKFMKPLFRREMLAKGFLRGAKDVRGGTVLSLMRGAAGKQVDFDTAWRMTSPELSEAQKAARENYAVRANRRALAQFQRQQKLDLNKRIIDASRISSQAGFTAYTASKVKPASRDEAGF
jgi:hypothetical protein